MPILIDTLSLEAEIAENHAVQCAATALRTASSYTNGLAAISPAALVFLLRKAGYSELGEPLQHS